MSFFLILSIYRIQLIDVIQPAVVSAAVFCSHQLQAAVELAAAELHVFHPGVVQHAAAVQLQLPAVLLQPAAGQPAAVHVSSAPECGAAGRDTSAPV